ncbi:MAG: HAMP domain-containing histidine kinase, partial [Rhodobacteraceae bacterium]|nr:HAMP domain-containing histidine kinase [Paracoccaceae bacterium]
MIKWFIVSLCALTLISLPTTLLVVVIQNDAELEAVLRRENVIGIVRARVDAMKLSQALTALPDRADADLSGVEMRYELFFPRIKRLDMMREEGAIDDKATWAARRVREISADIESLLYDEAANQRFSPLQRVAALKQSAVNLDGLYAQLEANALGNANAALANALQRSENMTWLAVSVVLASLLGLAGFAAHQSASARLMRARNAALSDSTLALSQIVEHRTKFLAHLSHEFRTPLNAIKGFSELCLVAWDGLPDARKQEYLRDVITAATALEKLTGDALDLSRIDTGRVTLVLEDLPACQPFERALKLAAPIAAEKGVAIEVGELCEDELRCDADLMQRALLNLLSNAVKYTDSGGRVRVSAARSADQVIFEVADTGCGVPAAEIDSVW